MKPVRAFFAGIAVFVAGFILISIMFIAHIGDVLGASPTHKPGDGTLLEYSSKVWFSGTFLSRGIIDRVFFGGPMPPEGNKIDPRSTQEEWRIYNHESKRRLFAYRASWIFSPLLFGFLFWAYAKIKSVKQQSEQADAGNRAKPGA